MTTWTVANGMLTMDWPATPDCYKQLIKPVFSCAIIGHEHPNKAEAQQCIAWLDDNWDGLAPTGLAVRDEWLKIRGAKA